MAVIQMTDDRFEEVVLKSELPVMVDFGATWCGPSKKVEPIVEELSEEYEGKMIAVKCDVEECPGTAGKYGIMNIPTAFTSRVASLSTKNVGAAPKKVFVEKLEKLF
jgi:Thioredoxin domain-containing protein